MTFLAASFACIWMLTAVAFVMCARRLRDTEIWLDRALRQADRNRYATRPREEL